MKNNFTVAAVVIVALVLLFLSRIGGFWVDVAALLVGFIFTVKFRHSISETFYRRLPRRLIVLTSALPFILFEEIINNPPNEYFIYLITVPALSLSIIILAALVKLFRAKGIWPAIIIYSVLGVLFETSVGAAAAEFRLLPPLTLVFMVFWVGLSYAFLAIVPLTIQLKKMVVVR